MPQACDYFLKTWQQFRETQKHARYSKKMSAIFIVVKTKSNCDSHKCSWPTLEMKDRYPGPNVSFSIRF